jgi:hypothetical protein
MEELTASANGIVPTIGFSKRCVNRISELLEYREDVKENDHATDTLRYS